MLHKITSELVMQVYSSGSPSFDLCRGLVIVASVQHGMVHVGCCGRWTEAGDVTWGSLFFMSSIKVSFEIGNRVWLDHDDDVSCVSML